jgi:hypothetical protein
MFNNVIFLPTFLKKSSVFQKMWGQQTRTYMYLTILSFWTKYESRQNRDPWTEICTSTLRVVTQLTHSDISCWCVSQCYLPVIIYVSWFLWYLTVPFVLHVLCIMFVYVHACMCTVCTCVSVYSYMTDIFSIRTWKFDTDNASMLTHCSCCSVNCYWILSQFSPVNFFTKICNIFSLII